MEWISIFKLGIVVKFWRVLAESTGEKEFSAQFQHLWAWFTHHIARRSFNDSVQ